MFGTTTVSRRARAVWTLIGLAGLTGGLAACGDGDDITGPIVAVTTVRDEAFNFTTLHTFAMPDTVVQVTALTGTPLAPSRAFDRVALDEVRQNLLLRGYTQVADPRTVTPDFVVLVASTATTNYDAYVTYPYYVSWGFYPGWGWYAPGFTSAWGLVYPWYAQVGVTAYDRGTLLVTLIPTKTVNPTARTIAASWAGVASALMNGAVTSTDVAAAIDQMFSESPYLAASAPLASRAP